jgi:putative FmdB family regulatory protein
MPTYKYICELCGKSHEIFHGMSEAPRKSCPSCGRDGLKKQIGTGAGIIFKGSGFYETDYRSENYKKKAEKEGKTESKKDDTEKKTEKNKVSSAENSA